MSDLREGTKVKTTTGLIGTVEAKYDLGTVVYYIVKLIDGGLYKFFADQLTEIEEEPEKAPEEKPTASDSIMITREEFRDKISTVVADILVTAILKDARPLRCVLFDIGPVLCTNAEIALFGELEENV